jgi:hypothetical protein
VDVRYPDDYYKTSQVKEGFLEPATDAGYVVEQRIDGEQYIRLTEHYFNEFGEVIKESPKLYCLEYWNRLVNDTAGRDIMFFLKRLCYTHSLIKRITNGEVDFCEQIGEELG